jgi:hypothetical protein
LKEPWKERGDCCTSSDLRIYKKLIRITPSPGLAGFDRTDDRMVARVKVFRRMLVL